MTNIQNGIEKPRKERNRKAKIERIVKATRKMIEEKGFMRTNTNRIAEAAGVSARANFGSKEKPIAYKVVGKSWVNNHAHVLRPRKEIDIDYLLWILSYYDIMPFLSGSTRFKLTKTDASRIPISFPEDLEEQKKIARAVRLRLPVDG